MLSSMDDDEKDDEMHSSSRAIGHGTQSVRIFWSTTLPVTTETPRRGQRETVRIVPRRGVRGRVIDMATKMDHVHPGCSSAFWCSTRARASEP